MERILKQREVTIEDLEKGVEFEVDENQVNLQQDFSDEEFNDDYPTFKDDISDVEGKNKPRFLGGSDTPFHVLKEEMKPVTEDGLVLKTVIRNGIGIPIPDKSVVMMHYEAFTENRKEPFDSTRLRNKPFKFLIGDGNVIPGLELGIQSMKKEELARIIVGPEYAFGPMGCPPRIPPNAEIMYEVEIINFHTSKDSIEFEDMNPEDQKKAPFEKIVGVYHCEIQMAKDLFYQKQYKAAIARYRRVKDLLEDVSVDNEENDQKRKEYLLKLYLNLSQCYINIQTPKKGVTYASLALKLDPKSLKGLVRMGTSLQMLNQYEDAEYHLSQAQKLSPYDKKLNRLLLQLEQKRKQHTDWEIAFSKRAMGMSITDSNESNKPVIKLEESPEFISIIREELKAFVESDERELVFSPGYTENQLDVVKALAQEFDLAFVSKIQCDKKINKVAKKRLSI